MKDIKIASVYRHFKGNYYYVEAIAYDSETQEEMVVYRTLYNRGDNKKLWLRPLNEFLSKIEPREDNITSSEYRFTYCEEFSKNFLEK